MDTDETVAALPLAVTRTALLVDGSDRQFRLLIGNLMKLSSQLHDVRARLARQIGVSEPEFRVFHAIAQLQGTAGIRVGAVARDLHVTGALVTMIAGRLVRLGWISKATNQADSRQVLLGVTDLGRQVIAQIETALQSVNDELFREIERPEFHQLSDLAERLVAGGRRVLDVKAAPRKSA